MRARQLFLESLLAHDVTMFFGNPGSTENAVVDGLFEYDALRYILALHEGVAVGAALVVDRPGRWAAGSSSAPP